jgi:hypothetical protein
MAKYIFKQPYIIRTGISVGQEGASGGTIEKSFNIGDIIEGVKITPPLSGGLAGQNVKLAKPNDVINTVVDGKKYSIPIYLVNEYILDSKESDNTSTTPLSVDTKKPIPNSFVFTPKMKKGIFVVLAIATVFYLLKVNKVI